MLKMVNRVMSKLVVGAYVNEEKEVQMKNKTNKVDGHASILHNAIE